MMQIESYSFGEMRIGERVYHSDVILLPADEGEEPRVLDSWRRKQGHRLDRDDLTGTATAKPEVLVVGTGCYGRMEVPQETREFLEELGIEVIAAPTGAATEKYNQLLAAEPKRPLAGAFHLTC